MSFIKLYLHFLYEEYTRYHRTNRITLDSGINTVKTGFLCLCCKFRVDFCLCNKFSMRRIFLRRIFRYSLVCVCWLVYIIYTLIALIRNRKSLINLSYLNTENDYKIRIFMQRESILRNSIFLLFLCFEVFTS